MLYHVVEEDGVRRLLFSRKQQSSMRLDDTYETDLPYLTHLHLPMAVKPDASSALLIGLGGGMLAKRMWRDYPEMRIDAIEVDEGVIQAAYEAFELPKDERLSVVHAEGREFLEASEATYDIISVDAFDDNAVPRPLQNIEFLEVCKERLSADGAIAYNLFGSLEGLYSKPVRSFYHTIETAWDTVWVFRVNAAHSKPKDVGNLVVVATDAQLTTDELLDRIADRVGGTVTVEGFEVLGEDLYRDQIDVEDAPVFHDPRLDAW